MSSRNVIFSKSLEKVFSRNEFFSETLLENAISDELLRREEEFVLFIKSERLTIDEKNSILLHPINFREEKRGWQNVLIFSGINRLLFEKEIESIERDSIKLLEFSESLSLIDEKFPRLSLPQKLRVMFMLKHFDYKDCGYTYTINLINTDSFYTTFSYGWWETYFDGVIGECINFSKYESPSTAKCYSTLFFSSKEKNNFDKYFSVIFMENVFFVVLKSEIKSLEDEYYSLRKTKVNENSYFLVERKFIQDQMIRGKVLFQYYN